MIGSRTRAVLLLSYAAALSGCAAQPVILYEGAERPATEVAHVRGLNDNGHTFWRGLNHQVTIIQVDGESAASPVNALLAAGTEEVILLPGKHSMGVKYSHMNSYAYASLWFIAEAGKNYTVQAFEKGYAVVVAIFDDATQKPVGGISGSIDEPKGPVPPASASASSTTAAPAPATATPLPSTPAAIAAPGPHEAALAAGPAYCKRGATLRARPTPDGAPLLVIDASTLVDLASKIRNDSGDWWMISVGNRKGWMKEADLSLRPD